MTELYATHAIDTVRYRSASDRSVGELGYELAELFFLLLFRGGIAGVVISLMGLWATSRNEKTKPESEHDEAAAESQPIADNSK